MTILHCSSSHPQLYIGLGKGIISGLAKAKVWLFSPGISDITGGQSLVIFPGMGLSWNRWSSSGVRVLLLDNNGSTFLMKMDSTSRLQRKEVLNG